MLFLVVKVPFFKLREFSHDTHRPTFGCESMSFTDLIKCVALKQNVLVPLFLYVPSHMVKYRTKPTDIKKNLGKKRAAP